MIEGCARHGIRGISPWRDQVAQMGLKEAVKSINSHGLTVTGLCRGGFFTAKNWRDDNRRAIEEAHALGAQCLVLVVGGLAEGSKDLISSRERAREGIATILPEARKAVGVAVDVYHVWWDPKLEQQIRRAGKRILAYHICDWLVPTRDLLNDRGMMGDGVIDLPRIRGWVEGAGYSGFHEVEIFSELDWWQRDPDEVLRVCKERYERCT
ncbi:MAG: sugar phosphate isomerase/epimerase [Betaproteobacteria bacterium]|nr:MAG: sugar phosphate isomerase/epimerase [Betaproteobacteria bacterium]